MQEPALVEIVGIVGIAGTSWRGRLQAAAEAAVGGSLVGLALRRGRLAQPCVCVWGGPLNPAQTRVLQEDLRVEGVRGGESG